MGTPQGSDKAPVGICAGVGRLYVYVELADTGGGPGSAGVKVEERLVIA